MLVLVLALALADTAAAAAVRLSSAEVVGLLARDWVSVWEGRTAPTLALPELAPAARLRREVKDRFDTWYQSALLAQAVPVTKVSPHAAPAAEEAGWLAPSPMLDALDARARRTFVSTEAVVAPGAVAMPPELRELRVFLEGQLHRIPPDPPAASTRALAALAPEELARVVQPPRVSVVAMKLWRLLLYVTASMAGQFSW